MNWGARIAGTLIVLAVLATALLYGFSETVIARRHALAVAPVPVPRDPASVAEGDRLATLIGCKSCHGNGKGGAWEPVEPLFGQIAPPPLARSVAAYSDADLVRLIRHGIARDGRGVFIMPVRSQRHLSDRDVGRLIAWLRTLRPAPDDSPERGWFGPLGRWQIATGKLMTEVEPMTVAPADRPREVGRYFTQALCSECHALHEARAQSFGTAPALAPVAAGYSPTHFDRLLSTGIGAGGTKVGFMSTIVEENLHALRPQERAAIHAYLVREATR
jgi:mono/diheme cytochrome c family protein